MRPWVVMLECSPADPGRAAGDLQRIEALLASLDGADPVVLAESERYGLQFRLRAPGPAEAIAEALRRRDDIGRALGLAPSALVRVELMTPEEHEAARPATERLPLADRP